MVEIAAKRLPPDPEEMNDDRAEWARKTIKFFARNFGEEPAYKATTKEQESLLLQNLQDILCDFAHYCDRLGVDMRNLLAAAANCYKEETNHDGTQFDS